MKRARKDTEGVLSIKRMRLDTLEEPLAAVLVDSLLCQPAHVRIMAAYFLENFVPTAQLAQTVAPTPVDAAEWLGLLVRRLVLMRPHDLVLRVQTAVLPSAHAVRTRPLVLISFLPPMASADMSLGIPDTLFVDAEAGNEASALLCEALAVACSEPTRFWSRVSDDGLSAHVLAAQFKHGPTLLRDAYQPACFVAHVLRLGLAFILRELQLPAAAFGDRDALVRELGVPLVRKLGLRLRADVLERLPGPLALDLVVSPPQRALLDRLVDALVGCESLSRTLATVEAVAHDADAALAAHYKARAGKTRPRLPRQLCPPDVPHMWVGQDAV